MSHEQWLVSIFQALMRQKIACRPNLLLEFAGQETLRGPQDNVDYWNHLLIPKKLESETILLKNHILCIQA